MHGDHLRVLVVGMGGDVEHAARVGEATQLLQDRSLLRGLGAAGAAGQARQDGQAEGGAECHVA